jgi:UDP-3-O-[3-hydroxymyristoyl] glucosamine N-acyltransferase
MTIPPKDSESDRSLRVEKIAAMVNGRLEGDPTVQVRGIAPIDQAQPYELGFLAQKRYLKYLEETRAGALLVSEALASAASDAPARVVVEEPHQVLPAILGYFYPEEPLQPGIHPTAVLGRGVVLGESVSVGPYAVLDEKVVVGDRVRIGAHAVLGTASSVGSDSVLHPHVVLYPRTRVGSRVILHAGVKLGVDGFGFVPMEGGIRKVPQVGACVVGDDVEIGSNSCVDRGSIGQTVIGDSTKLDNLVHLAHNVQVGRGALLTAMVGIAGSTRVGDGTMFGGQAGVVGHVEIGQGARIGAQAGVIGDVAPGETVAGFPARNSREFFRAMGMAFRLPDTIKRLEALEKRVLDLEPSTDK